MTINKIIEIIAEIEIIIYRVTDPSGIGATKILCEISHPVIKTMSGVTNHIKGAEAPPPTPWMVIREL